MQEGILSLMQLPKTVCAVDELHEARCAFISVMTHPTTAGVLASFASLGDVIVSEPGALLAFTGPSVVQQTTREKLPDDFGLAESNARFGHVDAIVPRAELRPFVGRLLAMFSRRIVSESPSTQAEELKLRERLAKLRDLPLLRGVGVSGEMARLKRQLDRMAEEEPSEDEVWRAVELARHQDRPYTLDYIERMCDDFVELHGDRALRRRPGDRRRASPASTGAPSSSSATRRAGTSASARTATSAWPTRRATARRCARWSSPTGIASP